MNEDVTFFDVNNYTNIYLPVRESNTHYTKSNVEITEKFLIKKFAVLKVHCVCDIACVN